jgi:hypothetical protein
LPLVNPLPLVRPEAADALPRTDAPPRGGPEYLANCGEEVAFEELGFVFVAFTESVCSEFLGTAGEFGFLVPTEALLRLAVCLGVFFIVSPPSALFLFLFGAGFALAVALFAPFWAADPVALTC